MAKSKRLGVSIFIVLLTIMMAASIILTFSISYMFSQSGVSGKMFGKYIYIMETADMMPELEKGAAIISDEDKIAVLVEGNVVLFKNGNREDVMRIRSVVHNTDNTNDSTSYSTTYKVSSDAAPENLIEITKEKVIAKCITESKNLGTVITFLSGMAGIFVGMILPCLVILAILIIKIVAMKKSTVEENTEQFEQYNDDEDDDEFKGFNGHQVKKRSPLFNPESDINPSDSFEVKKSSIAENFRQKSGATPKKPARNKNKNAPTAAVEKFKAAVEEKPNVPVRKSSLMPENIGLNNSEKLESIKDTLNNPEKSENPAPPSRPVNILERTATFSAIKSYRNGVEPPPQKTTPPPPPPAPVKKPDPSKTSNINSIDELIKALEEEKKKL